jgi:hypothetical protein
MFERLKDCADRINDQLAGDARSRFNTIYLTSFFIGAAGGSSIASMGACRSGASCMKGPIAPSFDFPN